MPNNYEQIDLSKIKTYPIKNRKNLVKLKDFVRLLPRDATLKEFIGSLPDILKGVDLKELIKSISQAYHQKRPVLWACGAHVIKCGLSPLVIELMKKGLVNCLSLNGAGIIHDFEIALIGETSEDVSKSLLDGSFGMAKETGELINEAIIDGARHNLGIGRAVGKMISAQKLKYREYSILYQGFELNIPITVHVAIGTDIIHQHPNASGEAIGKGSMIDFHIFTNQVANLEGGVFINIGSAVIIPEVFLKALTIVRNLNYTVEDFVTANFDMMIQYRPMSNIVKRPTLKDGKGYSFIGHHEIMLPLLAYGLLAEIQNNEG
ncbi:MAG: hypothetical protein AB1414_09935 [bacterium]